MRTLLGSLVLTLTLSSCSLFGDDGPSAEDAVRDLAAALTNGSLASVEITGQPDPQKWFDDGIEGLGDAELVVSPGEVTEEGEDAASAQLSYEWTFPTGAVWRYDATAQLTKGELEWSVDADPALISPELSEGERLSASRVWAPRADILGAGGERIVQDRPVLRIGIDKTKVAGAVAQDSSARALAVLVDVDPVDLAAQVKAAGDKAFVEAIVLRDTDVTPDLGRGIERIRGAVGLDDEIPLAPSREFARPILGTFGAVTAEIVEESEGVYEAGDEGGLSGLQARYDEQLRGTVGVTVYAVPEKGERQLLWEAPPEPGQPLKLTLDVRLQVEAERLLASVGPASALVAIKPSTGAVLVSASGPGGGGLSTATVGQYAPGSTMKVVSSLALLRAGLTANSPVDCPATTVVNGKSFKNYDDYPSSGLGRIDLARALANSCNTAFIGQRGKVSQGDLADAAASLGLGVDHDLGYPVYLGSVPAKATSETDHAASMIGQARVLASPIAMASVAASVGSGRTVVPMLVPDFAVDASPRTPLKPNEADQLRSLMRGVVTSGSGSFLLDVPGAPVLAKTGTAEFGDQEPPQTHAWMIAVHGDLAVAVFVDVGESGSRTAGPILEAFLRAS
ncbi:MAG TPA: penicillin-binding transpeptidase domain-containing protein [Nocardioidaceae bacterium]|nr:penicillin-binding transpeptidase domain-containing protein [Nocardioidaceae bacterium]